MRTETLTSALAKEYMESLNWRYATKKFDPSRTIPEADLKKLLDAVRLSASSYGLQPYKVLVVEDDDCVYMRTVSGLERVDVIYRRIDDEFMDPEAFRDDSILGVPGLLRAWKARKVGLANAPGAGVADDKVVYAFVPEIIKYYLDEKPGIPNVPTYRCMYPDEKAYVLDHLDELVIKPANESGGYGMLIGPTATKKELREFRKKLAARPGNYIAQPTLALSTAPVLTDEGLAPRHVDARPGEHVMLAVTDTGVGIPDDGVFDHDAAEVSIRRERLVVLVDGHDVLVLAMCRTFLDHPYLVVTLNDRRLDFSYFLFNQDPVVLFTTEDLLSSFNDALGTERVGLSRPAQLRPALLPRLEQRLV
mgnify:CR=1 FL=1